MDYDVHLFFEIFLYAIKPPAMTRAATRLYTPQLEPAESSSAWTAASAYF